MLRFHQYVFVLQTPDHRRAGLPRRRSAIIRHQHPFAELLAEQLRLDLGRAPVLTDIGRRIFDHAGDVLDRSDRTFADIRSLQSARGNVLSFASQRFLANHLLSKPLAEFARMHPGIEIIADIGALEHAIENIRHCDVDLRLFLARGAVKRLRSEVIGHQ